MSTDNLEELILVKFPDAQDAPDGPRREYTMYPVQEANESQEKPGISISPPGAAARNNVIVGVQGQNADIPLEFAIWEDPDGTDRANGTHSSTVVTVAEQINYLRDVMHDPSTTVPFELTHSPAGQLSERVYDQDSVYFETLDMTTISASERKWKTATIRLQRGVSG
jgi:hypothetical protein